jgi:hypothetical protein
MVPWATWMYQPTIATPQARGRVSRWLRVYVANAMRRLAVSIEPKGRSRTSRLMQAHVR